MSEIPSQFNDIWEHLNALRGGNGIPANHTVFDNTEMLLNGEITLFQDYRDFIINRLGGIILDIVKSDFTTAEAKNESIKLFDIILSQYTFEEVLNTFNMSLLIEGLQSEKPELKILVTHVLQRADPADLVANTSVILDLVDILKDPSSPVSVVNAVDKCLVQLATRGKLVRRRIISAEVIKSFRYMKQNSQVAPRLFDVILDLLPLVPTIPNDLYLVSESDFVQDNDILLDSYLISFYGNLLQRAVTDYRLSFIIDKLDEQILYISKVYIAPEFKKELKSDYNIESVRFLALLSQVNPEKFSQVDSTLHILDYATSTLPKEASKYFLSKINPRFLQQRKQFIDSFTLGADNFTIFCNMASDPDLLKESKVTSAQIINLDVSDFLEVMSALASTKFGIQKLVADWSSLINKVLEITNVTNPDIWNAKIHILGALYDARNYLGIWSPKIVEEYSLMKNGKPLTAQPAVMDTSA